MEDLIILAEEESKNISDEALLSERNERKNKSLMEQLNDFAHSFKKIKIKEKIIFYRLMATMLNAGMSLIKGIAVLERQEKNPLFKKILSEILIGLQDGKNLSDCMDMFPASFSEAEIGVIRSGEKT